jgi:hypothetical protein
MDFYNKLKNLKTWDQFVEFLQIFGLNIVDSKISFFNEFKKFLKLPYEISLIIGNSIVHYKLDLILQNVENQILLKVKNIEII